MDRHTKEQRSYNMSRIKSTGTALETRFFGLLDASGVSYQAHPKIYGKPDCIIGDSLLVFVDSDFWHGWHFNQWRERLPQDYWVQKIERNMKRDRLKFRSLRRNGYQVARVWEHTLLKEPDKTIAKIKQLASSAR